MSHADLQPARNASYGADRRSFCLCALAAGMSMACGGGSTPATAPPPPPTGGPLTTTDTKAEMLALPNDTVRDYRNLGNFFLIKDATGIYAMTAVCTHMGCIVGLPAGTVITCPCHGSQYALGGGNLLGPATLPLVHFAVTEASPGGALLVNPAQIVSASVRLT